MRELSPPARMNPATWRRRLTKIEQFYDWIRSSASPSHTTATENSESSLIDSQAGVVLVEKVDDRDTYEAKLAMEDGSAIHVWIDARTFLAGRIEGQPADLMAYAIQRKSSTATIGRLSLTA
jgi:hypothetical protein